MTAAFAEPTYAPDLTAAPTVTLVARLQPVVGKEDARSQRLTATAQRRAAARIRDLTALLRERPDLAGVHAAADFAVDAVLWCA